MKADELRQAFLDYFRERGHTIVPSSSLVPEGDPSLLFTVAGMVPFKQYYASKGAIPFTRVVSAQKCLRATDLEEVGRTIKHHTFFEMLGNFSFGDYFKEEAIEWAWEFITEVLKLKTDRLWVTVYEKDDESERIWTQGIGLDPGRIFRLGECDNFWGPAGSTGACGPCSEIHFDMGKDFGCRRPECSPACSCDRFVEVWNLVFPQFFQQEDSTRRPLLRRGIDTGMGLERLAMVHQGLASTYDTDLLKPIVDFVKEEANLGATKQDSEVSVRVIADHVRALCFAVCEGVLPSNEGRGYVIRRILRRAVVKALDLGVQEAFLFKAAGVVIDMMRHVYPELAENKEKIAIVIKSDEERFQRTLSRGMAIFKDTLEDLTAKGDRVITGEAVFKLYDTYGFPIEITREIASAQGFEIDLEGFEREMEEQRERARQASKIGKEVEAVEELEQVPENFVGYDTFEVPTIISFMTRYDAKTTEIAQGEEAEIELERTPFYPEGGGQVSDSGTIAGSNGKAVVSDVRWLGGRKISHLVTVENGNLSVGDGVIARVDAARRKATQRNHTATHLLHCALRSVLGGHVRQSGSLVAPDRLRFDFTHYEPLSEDDVQTVEDMVNARVLDNLPVRASVEPFEKAKARGATALFGEKYGQEVRVIEIEGTSCELCGGTHVRSTGDIGGFRIVSESGIAAGVRRIEAVTGRAVIDMSRDAARELERISQILKVPVRDLEEGARKVADKVKTLEKEASELRQRLAVAEVEEILKKTSEVDGVKVVTARAEVPNLELLKHLADRVKERLPDGVVCVGGIAQGRAVIVVSVGDSLVRARGIKASFVAKKLGEIVGGRGGGKDTFAQAGGKDVDKLDEALKRSTEVIASIIR